MIRTIQQTFTILALSVVMGMAINALSRDPLPLIRPPDEREGKWPVLTADEVMQRIEEGSALAIDARDAKYFEEGHIPGAINLPASTFGETFAETGDTLPRDFPLIVYCQGGPCDESFDVLEHLEVLEFQSLHIYKGGWLEWEEKKLPVETSEPQS